jgi:hypothetical protein
MNGNGKWLARLLVAGNAILACLLILQEPSSLLNQTVDRAGLPGHISVSALVVLGFLAVVDVVINDLLPPKYELRCALQYRHTVYMLIALGCLSLIFVIVKSHGPSSSMVHYGMVAVAAMVLAVYDLRDRYLGNPR